jgi:hypothetical protein
MILKDILPAPLHSEIPLYLLFKWKITDPAIESIERRQERLLNEIHIII